MVANSSPLGYHAGYHGVRTDEDTLAAARNIDPYALLSKPVDTDHLCDIVRKIAKASNPTAGDALSAEFLLDTLYDIAQVGMCVTDENRRFVRAGRRRWACGACEHRTARCRDHIIRSRSSPWARGE